MTERPDQVNEADLHAYVDGQLDAARRAAVESYLAASPAEAERVQAYQELNESLRSLYEPQLQEPVPAELMRAGGARRPAYLARVAASTAWVLLGGIAGWLLHSAEPPAQSFARALVKDAVFAHVVYTPEVRHPVEVAAEHEQHLVQWLSRRLGAPVRAPHLNSLGYELVGGRLLPAEGTPAAQFMYQNAQGTRLTLYLRTGAVQNRATLFEFSRQNNVSVFYWIDGPLGYALSGELEKGELLRIATAIYHASTP